MESLVQLLKEGQVVAIPTETVYGLAASYQSEAGVKEIFRLKNRPQDNPLILHLPNKDQLQNFVDLEHFEAKEQLETLISTFWPGPLTLVLPIKEGSVSPLITAGLSTAAFRVPKHEQTLKLLEEVGPVVAPSANLSGRPTATEAAHVRSDFGDDFPLLDGGRAQQGLESTIVGYFEGAWSILRQGALTQAEIEQALLVPVPIQAKSDKIQCPGQKYRHYAPHATLTLVDDYALVKTNQGSENQSIIGFSDRDYEGYAHRYFWGKTTQPEEVAKNLYKILRDLDIEKVEEATIDVDFPSYKPGRHTRSGKAETNQVRLKEADLEEEGKLGLYHTILERLIKASSR